MTAGIQLLMPAVDYPPDRFRQIIDVNLTGSFLCSQAFAREWTKRHGSSRPNTFGGEGAFEGDTASIVLTGSMSGHVANFGLECAAYNSSKAGVNMLSKTLAMEWGKRGIRVNVSGSGTRRTIRLGCEHGGVHSGTAEHGSS